MNREELYDMMDEKLGYAYVYEKGKKYGVKIGYFLKPFSIFDYRTQFFSKRLKETGMGKTSFNK